MNQRFSPQLFRFYDFFFFFLANLLSSLLHISINFFSLLNVVICNINQHIHHVNGRAYVQASSFVYIRGFTALLFCLQAEKHILSSLYHNINRAPLFLILKFQS